MSEVLFAPPEVKRRYYQRCEKQKRHLVLLIKNPRYDNRFGTFLEEGVVVLNRIQRLDECMTQVRESLGKP